MKRSRNIGKRQAGPATAITKPGPYRPITPVPYEKPRPVGGQPKQLEGFTGDLPVNQPIPTRPGKPRPTIPAKPGTAITERRRSPHVNHKAKR